MTSRGLPLHPRPRTKSAAEPPPHRPLNQEYALPNNPPVGSSMTPGRGVPDTPLHSASQRNGTWSHRPDVNDSRRALTSSPTSSTSSTSSSNRAGGNRSLASSRTTLPSGGEEEYDPGRKSYLRSQYTRNEEHKSETNDASVFTWNKVTEAANVFTQEVTKAWGGGLNPLGLTNARADTYEEEESHLTRVMRAYHLSKARTPSELPDWLFSEKERGQLGGLLRTESHHDDPHKSPSGRPRNHPGNSQITTSSNLEAVKNPWKSPTPNPTTPPVSRVSGADRLKTLRDARRTQRV